MTSITQSLLGNSLACLVGLNLILWHGRTLDLRFANWSNSRTGKVSVSVGTYIAEAVLPYINLFKIVILREAFVYYIRVPQGHVYISTSVNACVRIYV
jgi:hypothetical protein